MSHIKIVHVVAIDQARCIGKDNQLAWHLPADLQHFKNLTQGGVIVMGRKTFESLGRLLPKRSHHVISRDTSYQHDGVAVHHSLDAAIAAAKADAAARDLDTIHVIGGGEIYRQSLPLADVLEITQVDLNVQGDAFYPEFAADFECVSQSDVQRDEKSGVTYRFGRWQKRHQHCD